MTLAPVMTPSPIVKPLEEDDRQDHDGLARRLAVTHRNQIQNEKGQNGERERRVGDETLLLEFSGRDDECVPHSFLP